MDKNKIWWKKVGSVCNGNPEKIYMDKRYTWIRYTMDIDIHGQKKDVD